MNVNRMKWIAVLLPAFFVGMFEFMRHELFDVITVKWGNVMTAGVAALAGLLYFEGIFTSLKKLMSRLQEEKEEKATLIERERIARELHDSVSQALFFMNIKAKEIEDSIRNQDQSIESVKELREAIKITDTDVRQHIFNLKMVSELNEDMLSAIEAYIKYFREQSGIQIKFVVDGDVSSAYLSSHEINQLIRMFQEVLWNIRKHAKATRAKVVLQLRDDYFQLKIEDDGKGFDVEQVNKGSTYGLKIVKERAEDIHATLLIKSKQEQGTTVSIGLQLNEERDIR